MKKTLVIFANSIKHNQYCVAGKDIVSKKWIRPVADKKGNELSYEQTKVRNPYGVFQVKVLQKVKMFFTDAMPLPNQPENYIVSDKLWIQEFRITRNEVKLFLDNPSALWIDKTTENDRISYNLIKSGKLTISQSLYLIYVEKIHKYSEVYYQRDLLRFHKQ